LYGGWGKAFSQGNLQGTRTQRSIELSSILFSQKSLYTEEERKEGRCHSVLTCFEEFLSVIIKHQSKFFSVSDGHVIKQNLFFCKWQGVVAKKQNEL